MPNDATVTPDQQTSQPDQTQQTSQADQTTQTTQATSSTPAPAGPTAGEWEKERKGFLADLQKERQERQRLALAYQQTQSEYEQAQRRIQALAGVSPQDPQQAEDEAIRAALFARVPQLARLDEETVDRLIQIAEQGDNLNEAVNNHWKRHGTQMIGNAEEAILEELPGVSELTERQKKRIAREYVAYIEDNAEQGALDRHEAGDPALVQEFVTAFLGDWKESIRRSVTTQEVGRNRPVPSGRGRSVNPGGKKAINFNDDKAVADAAVAAFLEHGGSFGG